KLDEAVARILNIIQKAVKHKKENASYNKNQHHLLARAAAEESIVLLKNDDQMLPLAKSWSIAVIGEFAREARYQGSGSSNVNPNKLENALDEMTNLAGEGCSIQFAKGYDIKGDKTEQGLLEEAKELSAQADAVVLFVGLPSHYESEGYDRGHMNMPKAHNELIEAVSNENPNTIVVLSNGSPVEMPWIDGVKAVLEGY